MKFLACVLCLMFIFGGLRGLDTSCTPAVSTFSHVVQSLKLAIVVYSETLEQLQYTTRLNPDIRSYAK
jgi:hypothetical protein